MNKHIILYIVLLALGGAAGYLIGHSPSGSAAMPAMKAADSSMNMKMHNAHYDVPASEPTPTVTLQAFPDSESGWNLHIITTNFTYDPQDVGSDDVAGHGHIHILVDGVKVNRSYGDWYHLDALTPGKHTITAEMRTNKHELYYVGGDPVKASIDVTQDADASQAKEFDLTVQNGKVVSGSGDIQVMQGDMVKLVVTNDADNELHLHGYNIMTDLKAGQPGTITFQASASGRFPFELEGTKQEIGAVSVMPQ